jgi:hypothetical protein
MNRKGVHPGEQSGSPPPNTSFELLIGHEVVSIWFDARGIHFQHPKGGRTEGVLPWDIAMAMSLVPESRRRFNTPAA